MRDDGHYPNRSGPPSPTLRIDLATAEVQPRVCIACPGRTVSLAFPNPAAALAALHEMESCDVGR
jgi:hypothetical protein